MTCTCNLQLLLDLMLSTVHGAFFPNSGSLLTYTSPTWDQLNSTPYYTLHIYLSCTLALICCSLLPTQPPKVRVIVALAPTSPRCVELFTTSVLNFLFVGKTSHTTPTSTLKILTSRVNTSKECIQDPHAPIKMNYWGPSSKGRHFR